MSEFVEIRFAIALGRPLAADALCDTLNLLCGDFYAEIYSQIFAGLVEWILAAVACDRLDQRRAVVIGTELQPQVEGEKRPLGSADIDTCGDGTSACPSAS